MVLKITITDKKLELRLLKNDVKRKLKKSTTQETEQLALLKRKIRDGNMEIAQVHAENAIRHKQDRQHWSLLLAKLESQMGNLTTNSWKANANQTVSVDEVQIHEDAELLLQQLIGEVSFQNKAPIGSSSTIASQEQEDLMNRLKNLRQP